MEEREMGSRKLSPEKMREAIEAAKGWGKIVAREAFPQGPGLGTTLAEMEELAAAASRALVEGVVETLTADQAEEVGREAPCPTCGKSCALERKPRRVAVRGGTATLDEPVGHCSTCRRDFFPSASGVAN
jgi:hypothetical protein